MSDSPYRVPDDKWSDFCHRLTQKHRGEWILVERVIQATRQPSVHGRLESLHVSGEGARRTIVALLLGTPRGVSTFEVDQPTKVELSRHDEATTRLLVAGEEARQTLELRLGQHTGGVADEARSVPRDNEVWSAARHA